jgi:hypothetical protein
VGATVGAAIGATVWLGATQCTTLYLYHHFFIVLIMGALLIFYCTFSEEKATLLFRNVDVSSILIIITTVDLTNEKSMSLFIN